MLCEGETSSRFLVSVLAGSRLAESRADSRAGSRAEPALLAL